MYTNIITLLLFTTPSLQEKRTLHQNSLDHFFDDPPQGTPTPRNKDVNKEDAVTMSFEQYPKNIENSLNNYINNVQDSIGSKFQDLFSFFHHDDNVESERLVNPDIVLTVPGRILRTGYPCETHTVISEGYILNIHRIPRSKAGSSTPVNTVILHHGLFGSSADWILNGPGKALAYVLADAGYDVWMPNIRGNRYSREHTFLKTDTKPYWNFSWHDVALHDVPAIIDHIKTVKGSETNIAFVGYSMGTTILFAMLSLRPEYNDKLNAGFALGSIVFTSDINSGIKILTPMASNIASMGNFFGSHEFLPKTSTLGSLTSSCNVEHMVINVCKNAIFSMCGYNEAQFNDTLLSTFLAHMGTGTSLNTVRHYFQEIESGGKFQKFDFGFHDNKKIYGSSTPPQYDLSKITLPIKLFWSQNDYFSSEKDVQKLHDSLTSETEMYKVPDLKFNHLDYIWAKDAPTLVNNKLLEMLQKTFNKDSK